MSNKEMMENEPTNYRIQYLQGEDDLLYPDLNPTQNETVAPEHLNKLGTLAMAWLEDKNPLQYRKLKYSGELMQHLLSLQAQMMNRLNIIITQLKETEPAPDQNDTLATLQYHQMIQATAEEIAISEFLI